MEEVKFLATISDDKIIRLPDDISLPNGDVEVIVRAAFARPSSEESDIASMRAMLLRIAAEAEAEVEALGITLPSDMAENHDHYAHGKPLP